MNLRILILVLDLGSLAISDARALDQNLRGNFHWSSVDLRPW